MILCGRKKVLRRTGRDHESGTRFGDRFNVSGFQHGACTGNSAGHLIGDCANAIDRIRCPKGYLNCGKTSIDQGLSKFDGNFRIIDHHDRDDRGGCHDFLDTDCHLRADSHPFS